MTTTPTCPECHASLVGRDVEAHARSHWPDNIRELHPSPEALERREALLALRDHPALQPAPAGDAAATEEVS